MVKSCGLPPQFILFNYSQGKNLIRRFGVSNLFAAILFICFLKDHIKTTNTININIHFYSD